MNSSELLRAASLFKNQIIKKSQFNVEFSKDPMNVAINSIIGKSLSSLAAEILNTKAVSSLQINIKYDPPANANFIIYATGSDSDLVQKELAATLNSKFAVNVGKIMAKYQKDQPIDYKFASFEK